MTSEEKVLEELKEKITLLFNKISELKVTEAERKLFEEEKATFQVRLDDYKKHKVMLEEKYGKEGILSPHTA
jgi:hypothetical protein